MNYFTALSLVLGTALVFSRPILEALSRRWALREGEMGSDPRWTRPMSLMSMGVIGLSWYEFLTGGAPVAILVTLAATVLLYKAARMLLDYPRYKAYVVKVLNMDPRRKEKVTERMMIAGAALILMGVLVY